MNNPIQSHSDVFWKEKNKKSFRENIQMPKCRKFCEQSEIAKENRSEKDEKSVRKKNFPWETSKWAH